MNYKRRGFSVVEIILALGISTLIVPAFMFSYAATRYGRASQEERVRSTAKVAQMREAIKSIADSEWYTISDGNFYLYKNTATNKWELKNDQPSEGFGVMGCAQVSIASVSRAGSITGPISSSGTYPDPSTKKVTLTAQWREWDTNPSGPATCPSCPNPYCVQDVLYITRAAAGSVTTTKTTTAELQQTGYANNKTTQPVPTPPSNGEVQLEKNLAQWCSPAFTQSGGNDVTIDLPDGPPNAVAAWSNPTDNSKPNNIIVSTSPSDSNSIKMAHVQVTANQLPPVPSLKGKFTARACEYSGCADCGATTACGTYPGLAAMGNLDNNFTVNDVAYFTSGSDTYALLATDLPDKEVLVVWVDDGNDATNNEYQDPVNKIYKLKTFFNSRRNTTTTTNDYAPYGYGASAIAALNGRGYIASGAFLYVFDLVTNFSAKNMTSGLDMVGCRLQLEGYDCDPVPTFGTNKKKYAPANTDTNTGSNHSVTTGGGYGCVDAGNTEIYATRDIYPVEVAGNTYIYVAVGNGADPEFQIVNVTTPPTTTSPANNGRKVDGVCCGTNSQSCSPASGSGGDPAWKPRGNFDFNRKTNTQEAANSVFAKSDGTRAYITSNGGNDSDGNGAPDAKQFYILNTTNIDSPSFLSGTNGNSTTDANPTSGFYLGTGANSDMYTRKAFVPFLGTGSRVVLVGEDREPPLSGDSGNAQEYQVLNSSSEASPSYCGGLNFDSGFNDLAGVVEADGDTFVYMVANTTTNELRVVQGGPDGDYLTDFVAEYTSPAIDISGPTNNLQALNKVYVSVPNPAPSNTNVKLLVAVADKVNGSCTDPGVTYTFLGPDGNTCSNPTSTSSTCQFYNTVLGTGTITDGNVTYIGGSPYLDTNPADGYINPGKCVKVRAYLSTNDLFTTPRVLDVNLYHTQ